MKQAAWEARQKRTGRRDVSAGIAITVAFHALLVIAGLLVGTPAPAPAAPEPRFRTIEANLVRLGEPPPPDTLPVLGPPVVSAPVEVEVAPSPEIEDPIVPEVLAPPPASEPSPAPAPAPVSERPPPPPAEPERVTRDETPTPPRPPSPAPRGEVARPPPERRDDPVRPEVEDDAERKLLSKVRLDTAALSAARSLEPPRARPSSGDPRGIPEGNLVTTKDKIEGDRWAAEVRRLLHRAWAIPEVIPDADLRTLSATVLVQFAADGAIRTRQFRARAAGSSYASLFNNSVSLVFAKVSSLPPPPPGALKTFKDGWVALRFTKDEADRAR